MAPCERVDDFCPGCGNPFAWRGVQYSMRRYCTHCERLYTQRVNPTVSCVIVRGDQVLLVRRRSSMEPHARWSLPGGPVEPNEDATMALGRELDDQTGMKLVDSEYVGAWAGQDHTGSSLNLVFVADAEGEAVGRAVDGVALDVQWFPAHALPARLAEPHQERALWTVLKGTMRPNLSRDQPSVAHDPRPSETVAQPPIPQHPADLRI